MSPQQLHATVWLDEILVTCRTLLLHDAWLQSFPPFVYSLLQLLSLSLSLSFFLCFLNMSSTEYGAVNNQVDEEARVTEQRESGGQRSRLHKVRDTLHLHGHRIFAAWIIIIATAAVLTLSFHFSLLNRDKSSEDQDSLLEDQCVSDRSWFVALLLSIFFGPFGRPPILGKIF